MGNSKTLILIDGHALAFRQYYALERTAMKTIDGTQTWAVYGFFKSIFDLMKNKKLKPDAIAVTFDVGRQTFRVEKYEEYKAQREAMPDSLRSQLGLIIEGLQAFNIPIYTKEGFEADDVIGTISKKASELGHKTLILTGDQDSFQLIDKKGLTKVLIPYKGELIEYNWDKVFEKLGVYPNQVADYKGLRGDISDNIPGVKGIGEKTAQALLATYQTMENVFEHCDEIEQNKKSVYKKLCEGKNLAILSKDLATIVRDVPIDFDFEHTKISLPEINKALEFLKRMQFYSFVKNIDEILCNFDKDCVIEKKEPKTDSQVEKADMQLGLFSTAINESIKQTSFEFNKTLIENKSKLENLIKKLQKQSTIALQLKYSFKNAVDNELFAIGIGFEQEIYYINLLNEKITKIEILELLKPILENCDIKKILHNAKEQINILKNVGINLSGIYYDTMLASYISNPARNHDLIVQTLEILNFIIKENIDVKNPFEQTCEETFAILELEKYWQNKLSEQEKILLNDIELPTTKILAHMEYTGVYIDKNYLEDFSNDLSEKIKSLECNIYNIAGENFNINSPKQVAHILYEKLSIKSKKKTKGKHSLSTSVEVLEELAKEHKICEYLIEHRKYQKLKSTYTDSLIELISEKDNRIHTSYNQALTVTGRLSSSNPNLQNIPTRTEVGNKIRAAFIPENPSDFIFSADYSQIELRLLAHISKDETLIKAFNENQDIHSLTASKVFNIPLNEVTKEQRRQSKAVNFGIIYGQSKYGLSKSLNIPVEEAQAFINKYFKTYPHIQEYMSNTVQFAYENGYVETIFGRKRYLAGELSSNNQTIKDFAQRAAINQPLQGSAADLIKIAMINVKKKLDENGLKSKMIMQVHDELIFEAKENEIEKLKEIVKYEMEHAKELRIPLLVDDAEGKTWKE